MKKTLLSIGAIFALLGAEAPKWFSNPSLDSSYLYGFGVGKDIKNAKENALLDLASSLQSSVKVVFEREIQRNDTDISSKASQKSSISTQVSDLTNVEATKAECQDNQCYVKVEIKKSDLVAQLKQKIQSLATEISHLNSPFDYLYKKNKLYPKMLSEYALYSALGGFGFELPKLGEKPSFQLVFKYDGDFSKGFKGIFEKTIADSLTQFGTLSADAKWSIEVNAFREDKSVTLELDVKHNDEVIHNASVYDTQAPSVSSSFFAKRLGVQANKKMRKWGKN